MNKNGFQLISAAEKGDIETVNPEVTITIKTINAGFSEKQKTLATFRQLTREIGELNKTDPLPAEFDKILSQRVQFRELFSQAELFS